MSGLTFEPINDMPFNLVYPDMQFEPEEYEPKPTWLKFRVGKYVKNPFRKFRVPGLGLVKKSMAKSPAKAKSPVKAVASPAPAAPKSSFFKLPSFLSRSTELDEAAAFAALGEYVPPNRKKMASAMKASSPVMVKSPSKSPSKAPSVVDVDEFELDEAAAFAELPAYKPAMRSVMKKELKMVSVMKPSAMKAVSAMKVEKPMKAVDEKAAFAALGGYKPSMKMAMNKKAVMKPKKMKMSKMTSMKMKMSAKMMAAKMAAAPAPLPMMAKMASAAKMSAMKMSVMKKMMAAPAPTPAPAKMASTKMSSSKMAMKMSKMMAAAAPPAAPKMMSVMVTKNKMAAAAKKPAPAAAKNPGMLKKIAEKMTASMKTKKGAMSKSEIDYLKMIFKKADVNKDGTLSLSEFKSAALGGPGKMKEAKLITAHTGKVMKKK
mmetsp:Transcript_25912/g.65305  ORF Transcript_25912/g.65305 Transcript_25912/m.65305 type:complete len:431 (-) Transcript_25912:55-1347(-)|eukprot:CAMPEP_0178994852 /NCGR_PEP_ID=MMETSP0795-20121207/7513_1 /TAXON_ID=88552 /ORGANISM="Amoebophrya sp., Strain Ameob2" /LENGTH=430 /DNA_ID=CAMNT_0020687117 /DNA_START=264 /DNA_END=1556 /DNA_ORIENTATION=+